MNIDAAFFDIFGFIGFVILIATGIILIGNRKFYKWAKWVILTIGIIGAIIDGFIIIKTFVMG